MSWLVSMEIGSVVQFGTKWFRKDVFGDRLLEWDTGYKDLVICSSLTGC